MKTSMRMILALLFIVSLILGPTAGMVWAEKSGACKAEACKCGPACQCGEACKCAAGNCKCPKACKAAECKCGSACQCGEACQCTADTCKCPKAKEGTHCSKEGACCGVKKAA